MSKTTNLRKLTKPFYNARRPISSEASKLFDRWRGNIAHIHVTHACVGRRRAAGAVGASGAPRDHERLNP